MKILLVLVGLLLCSNPAWSAVGFNSTFEKSFNGTASPNTFVSNLGNVTGTVGTQANRALIITIEANTSVANMGTMTVTWAGVAATLISNLNYNASGDSIHVYGLLNPTSGNQTLSVSWTSGSNPSMYMGAISFYNVDQTTGWQNVSNDTGTSTSSSSTVTTALGNMAVVAHGNNNASTTVISAGSSAWIDTTINSNAAQGYLASIAGTGVVSWTLGTTVAWGNVKLDLIQSQRAIDSPKLFQ